MASVEQEPSTQILKMTGLRNLQTWAPIPIREQHGLSACTKKMMMRNMQCTNKKNIHWNTIRKLSTVLLHHKEFLMYTCCLMPHHLAVFLFREVYCCSRRMLLGGVFLLELRLLSAQMSPCALLAYSIIVPLQTPWRDCESKVTQVRKCIRANDLVPK